MLYSIKKISTVVLCLLISCCLTSCNKKQKVGTLQISETEYTLEKDDQKTTISLNVRGKIKNTSPYDIKGIEITGRCKSCTEEMHAGKWFVTQEAKTEDQKDTISYLSAGADGIFRFEGIAYFFKSTATEIPESYPEDLEVYVASFTTVQD
ncbi:MAG: hypothetical protein PF482_16660 [Desulfobacteraceae bacterium]|jgi:hypothetical protein|nr:hypothetical protein [Desulfobacteraceae bacterium]